MTAETISLPSSTAIEHILPFAIQLERCAHLRNLRIEIPDKAFFSPFVMLFLGSKIRHLRSRCPDLSISFDSWDRHKYASHMGFFDLCGFNYGRHVGEAWGSRQYLPITKLTRAELVEKDFDRYEEVQDLVQRRAEKISAVLTHDPAGRGPFFNVMAYCIREVMRNVFEHGQTESLYYCAQYWPNSDKVELAVADSGIGIRQSLGKNPNFRYARDKEAIEAALWPSVSGQTHEPRKSSVWFNSGYGLYMISRLARNGGSFVMASGESAICLTPKTKTNFGTSFHGTILRVSFKVTQIGDVQKRLAEFRQEGKEIAERIRGSGNRPPSSMSMLLRRDYETY